MTEYNLFCYAEEFNNNDSFQQKRYRVFNKQVGEKRYKEVLDLVRNDILKDFKLEFDKNNWEKAWQKLDKKQIKRLQEIPEFDANVFEGITGIKVDGKIKEEKMVKVEISESSLQELKKSGIKIKIVE